MTKKKADIGGKRLISLAPEKWVRWLTENPNLIVKEILSSDFQWVARENDVLLKVYSPEEGEFLILNELQLRYSGKMPQRINAYASLAEERYDLKVYPVLVNILPISDRKEIPNFYHSELMGMISHRDYRVINLWEIDANLVFEQQLSTLLPFVPILKNGDNETIVRQAVQLLRKDENLQELEPLLSFFASFVLDIPLVQQIMRWDMAILQESPWYQEIMKQGKNQGSKEEGINLVSRLIKRRFGLIPPEISTKINNLSVEKLELLAEEMLDITDINVLKNWLREN
jgi:predicted transposase YdaD